MGTHGEVEDIEGLVEEGVDPSDLGVFAAVHQIGPHAKLAVLTADPRDALSDSFDEC